MREKLLALAELQKVDLEIAALQKTADAYPLEIAGLQTELDGAKSLLDSERVKLDELERQRSQLEHTVAEDKDRVKKWEARLTEQRSTREYSALAREIDIARKGQQTMSEEINDLGRQVGVQRDTLKQRDADFLAQAKDLNGRIAELTARLDGAKKEVAGMDGRRVALTKVVDSNLLRRYETIRKKRMPALVPLAAPGTCTGCRISIRAQLFNTLVASKGFDVCPSCQRIVYAAETIDGAPATEA